MANTKSASKLQNFPDIAMFFGEKLAYKPHFSLLFLFLITFLLSHQIFRNQIHEHRLRKIGYSQLLIRSIFGLVFSDNKLTRTPIYACIQMEVAFVSLLYADISTTFAINIKRSRTVVFILQPSWYVIGIDSCPNGTNPSVIVLYDVFSALSSHPFSSDKVMVEVREAHHWWHQSDPPPSAREEKWKAKDCPLFHSQTYGWWSSQAQ